LIKLTCRGIALGRFGQDDRTLVAEFPNNSSVERPGGDLELRQPRTLPADDELGIRDDALDVASKPVRYAA
jgi:hypothetical protein